MNIAGNNISKLATVIGFYQLSNIPLHPAELVDWKKQLTDRIISSHLGLSVDYKPSIFINHFASYAAERNNLFLKLK